MDATLLANLDRALDERTFTRIDGPVIARSGAIVHEWYLSEHTATVPHDLRSATKSITSALFGIALDLGHIDSIDDPVCPLFETLAGYPVGSGQKSGITARHLLTMSAGWDCDDSRLSSEGNENYMYRQRDWVRFILGLDLVSRPGDRYSYCNGDVVVLGEVIRLATGGPVDLFAHRHLFGPLGITSYEWSYTPAGQVDNGGHLFLTPRDMAKIGQLFLQQGTWKDDQLISADWVEESTAHQITTDGRSEYGYLWWRRSFESASRTVETFYASGNGEQFIFVVPSIDLVVSFTGRNYNSAESSQPLEMMSKFILPAVN